MMSNPGLVIDCRAAGEEHILKNDGQSHRLQAFYRHAPFPSPPPPLPPHLPPRAFVSTARVVVATFGCRTAVISSFCTNKDSAQSSVHLVHLPIFSAISRHTSFELCPGLLPIALDERHPIHSSLLLPHPLFGRRSARILDIRLYIYIYTDDSLSVAHLSSYLITQRSHIWYTRCWRSVRQAVYSLKLYSLLMLQYIVATNT